MAATSDLPLSPQEKAAPKTRRCGPLPIADAYLLRSVVESSLRGLGWFAGLFLAFAIVTSARKVAQDDLPFSLVVELIAMQAPRIILFTIPASLLFGAVSTFTEMSARGEITALMAGGMSLWRMLRAPLTFAAVMAAFAFYLQEVVVPGAELRKSSVMARAASKIGVQDGFKLVDLSKNGTVKRIVQADSFDPSQKLLVKPVIQLFREDNTVETEIKAQSARWDAATKSWVFENGSTVRNGSPDSATQTFSVPTSFTQLSLQTDVAPTPDSLQASGKTAQEHIRSHNYEMVNWRDLETHRARLSAEYSRESGEIQRKTGKEIRAATFGIHDKFATPLVCLAMMLIGAPLGIRPQRSASAGLAMGLSLLVLILYYLVWTIASQWGKAGGAGPLVAAYLSFALTAGIGLVMVARKS